ncbi:condensation domain-containing protein [Flexibacterium corallicola]|uniref:hypothetical protein n=1 Tax=Flexibacterium corallicola TaxID=3037259 RepID=UPI00286EC162|nr:hypothetical protein [Pseudovibrio sp. M1P-2-3]
MSILSTKAATVRFQRFIGAPFYLDLSFARMKRNSRSTCRKLSEISVKYQEKFNKLSLEEHTVIHVQAALALALGKFANCRDVAFGTDWLRGGQEQGANLITVARVEIPPECESVRTFLEKVTRAIDLAQRQGPINEIDFLRGLGIEPPVDLHSFYQVYCRFEDRGIFSEPFANLPSDLDIAFAFALSSGGTNIKIRFRQDLFEVSAVKVFARLVASLAEAMGDALDQPLGVFWEQTLQYELTNTYGNELSLLLARQKAESSPWYPLTLVQQDQWLSELTGVRLDCNVILGTLDLPKDLDLLYMKKVLRAVADACEFTHLKILKSGLQSPAKDSQVTVSQHKVQEFGWSEHGPAVVLSWHEQRLREGGDWGIRPI